MFDPKQVGEEANKMIAELNQPPVAEDQPVIQSEAIAPGEEVQTSSDQGVEQGVVTGKDERLTLLEKQAEAAEQRWRVLQGMIDKKDTEIDSLRALLAQLAQSKPDTQQSQPPQEWVTKEDEAKFGDDLIDVSRRISQSVIQAELGKLWNAIEARFQKLEGSMNGVQQDTAKTAQEVFFDALRAKVPDWEQVNSDPAFLAWLGEPDMYTGVTKLALLQDSVTKRDAVRAAKFFTEYKKLINPEQPEVTPPQARLSKAHLVSPGRSKAPAANPNPSNKRTWSRPEIAKLYDDHLAGRISQKDFEEYERDIFAAQHENRIAA